MAPSNASPSSPQIYHEKQQLLRCGLHAVNALLRHRAYTPKTMDALADRLANNSPPHLFPWCHPHRAMLGLGNYDVNVLMCALEERGLRAEWMAKGKEIGKGEGFLINVKKFGGWGALVGGRHWIAVVAYRGGFWEVDSERGGGREIEVGKYLERVWEGGGEVLRVVRKEKEG